MSIVTEPATTSPAETTDPRGLPSEARLDGTGEPCAATGEARRGLNRAQRRELDRQRREQEAAERGLLAELVERNRAQLVPHAVTAGLLGLAGAIHALSAQVNTVSVAATVTGLAAAAAGAAGVALLRRREQLLAQWQMWAGLLAATTTVWLVIAVAHGVTWGTFAAALGLEYAFGARWWRHHRHSQPVEPGAPIVERDEPEIDHRLIATYPRRWAERIGCTGGVLAGASLVDGTVFDHGIEYTLALVGGKQDLGAVQASISKIASGLEHPALRLIPEPFLSSEGEENPALVKFSVVTSSPIADNVFFREPVIRKGYIPLGPFADGRGMAAYQLHNRKRMLNGLVIGGTGSGKSRLLELIGLVAMWTGQVYVIHADGMNGASCPMLWEHTEHYGRADTDELLDLLEAMQAYREVELGRQQRSGFRPSREFPGVFVIMDEAHRMITDKNWRRWCALAREINKLGMGLLCADQDAKLSTWHDGTMRASLQSGNGIGLRVKDRAAGQILDSGGFNLFDLPKSPGVGFVMESDDPEARQAPYRGLWLPDRDDAYPEDDETGIRTTERQVPEDITLIEDWYAQAPRISLDAGTAAAKDQPGRSPATARPTARQASAPSEAPVRVGAVGPAPQEGSGPVAATLPMVPTPGSTAAEQVEPIEDELSAAEQRVLAAVTEGIATPGAIAGHLELSRQYVAAGLRTLVLRGLVDRTGNGPAVRYDPSASSTSRPRGGQEVG